MLRMCESGSTLTQTITSFSSVINSEPVCEYFYSNRSRIMVLETCPTIEHSHARTASPNDHVRDAVLLDEDGS